MATMQATESAQNYYDVLGVRPNAAPEEIRRRYKFLVIAFHPDRFVRTPEHHALAELRLKQVNEAYRVLSDPQARAHYDMLRLTAFGGQTQGVVGPWLSQVQYELEQARARIAQLEQEVAGLRSRLESAGNEKTALQQELGERNRLHQQDQHSREAEVARLTGQLEQLARERAALDSQLRQQIAQTEQKTTQLGQELASQHRLVENLTTTKAEWEKSTQSRQDLLSQQVRKLKDDVARREASLQQQKQANAALQERLTQVEHEARLASQAMAGALRNKQQEVDSLLAASKQVEEDQGRERRSIKLWQVAAVIAIVNTLLLLALFLMR